MIILDTTIRDGSYLVDFKFSCRDVENLVEKSNKIGLQYIEIGHGQGLNASSIEHGFSLHTDQEYIAAAKGVSGKSKLGCFCIPGIARLCDLDAARDSGLDFVRIGTNINESTKAVPYIEHANKLGLIPFVNMMKTYAASPEDFASRIRELELAGAFCAYIVDSAGSMQAEDIRKYIEAARSRTQIKLGFHGHNNLGLAVSNSVFCVESGIDFVDATFQGIGRSAGNASLEQLVMVLKKKGYDYGFDIPRVLEYGYSALHGVVKKDLINPLDLVCGYAGFHSSFIKSIYMCCIEKKVDPLRLIIAYSEINRTEMNYQSLCDVADTLPVDKDDNPYSFAEYFSDRYRL